MPPLQLGLDLATSLSVLGAAVAFIISLLRRERRAQASALKQQRIENMSRLINDFAKILEEGDKIVGKVRLLRDGRDVQVTEDDMTSFCVDVDRYIRINSALLFEIWASEKEKQSIEELRKLVLNWNQSFVQSANDRSQGKNTPVPHFDKLISDLIPMVTALSSLLRVEVERVVA